MLLGEKVANGALIYSEVWDSIAPLSALLYSIIDYFFGRSQIAYQFTGYLLICFQVFIFNRFLLTSRAYSENTYVPGLIYGILATVCYDMVTLTPFLIGLTFILLALKNIFNHIEVRAKRDEDILNIGLYIGLATISYLPFCVFALATLTIFIFFTGTVTRRYFLMTFGFLLPIILASGYFYLTNRLNDFVYSFFSPFTTIERVWFVSLKDTLRLFVAPLAFFVLALTRIIRGARLTNYQSRLTQTILVWSLFSILFILLADQNSPAVYLILAPGFAFYISHYFLMKKRGFFSEMSFTFFAGLCIATFIFSLSDSWLKKYYNDEAYLLENEKRANEITERILVLEQDFRPYLNAEIATPFLNWQLSKQVFTNLNYYDNLTIVYNGINNDKPEVIIDPKNLMFEVFEEIPALRSLYFKSADGHYHLKINN